MYLNLKVGKKIQLALVYQERRIFMSGKKIAAIFITLMIIVSNINFVSAAEYEYDALGRLIKATYNSDSDSNKSASYSYDKGGNITNVSGFNGGGTVDPGPDKPNPEPPTETTSEEPIESNVKVWNHTIGENTDDFFSVTANEWNSAVPIIYGDITLTKAVKMESKTTITFEAPKSGKLTLVTHATAAAPAVKINDTSYAVAANGETVIEIPEAGIYTITKDTTNTYLYYISFVYETEAPPAPAATYVWNHTDDTNTEDFFTVTANEWNSAVPVTYGDLTLTKAVKMESSTSITFTAPKSGTLTLVTYATNNKPAVKVNGTSYPVSVNGATEIPLTED